MSGESVVEEHDLPTEPRPEDIKWRFFVDGAITRALDRLWNKIEVRMASVQDRGPDPDYASPLTAEDLERAIRQIARDHEPGVRISNRGRSGAPKWLSKLVLGVAILLIAGAVTTTATTIVVVASLGTKIDAYITSNDKRLDRDEHLIDDNTKRLDRGAGVLP